MNQILMTDINNKKTNKSKVRNNINNSGESQIVSIVKFFAIAMIIFGLVLSGGGAYGTYQIIQKENSTSTPIVNLERNGNTIKMTVSNDIGIKSVSYAWNDSNVKTVTGNNKTQVNAVIIMSNSTQSENVLNITVIDANNNSKSYQKTYVQNGEDTANPEIEITNEDPKIKVTITDDTALDHVVYKYGDAEEKTIQASEDDPTQITFYIDDVKQETTNLQIEAVDKAQNVATKEQQVKGVTKPKIEVTQDASDSSYIIINVTDNDGLKMVSYYINGQEYKTDPNVSLNQKTFTYRQKIQSGTTNVTVHAYNISEQVTEYTATFNY